MLLFVQVTWISDTCTHLDMFNFLQDPWYNSSQFLRGYIRNCVPPWVTLFSVCDFFCEYLYTEGRGEAITAANGTATKTVLETDRVRYVLVDPIYTMQPAVLSTFFSLINFRFFCVYFSLFFVRTVVIKILFIELLEILTSSGFCFLIPQGWYLYVEEGHKVFLRCPRWFRSFITDRKLKIAFIFC